MKITLICHPCVQGDTKGSVKACSKCGQSIWLSDSTADAVELKKLREPHITEWEEGFLCLDCAKAEGIDMSKVAELTKSQRQELMSNLNLTEEELDKRIEWMKSLKKWPDEM